MTDVFSLQKRSAVMAVIKCKDTKPEVVVRKFLRSNGIGYRKNVRSLPGCPDLDLSKYKCAILINGCFWHGHEGCTLFRIPKTRTEWWIDKIQKTKQRDQEKMFQIQNMGWRTIVIWECELEKAYHETTQNLSNILRATNFGLKDTNSQIIKEL